MAVNLKRFIKQPEDQRYELHKEEWNDGRCGAATTAVFKPDGSMVIESCSWGEDIAQHYGDWGVDFYNVFDSENLLKLKQLLEKKGNEGFSNQLRKRFFADTASTLMFDSFCMEHNVRCTSNNRYSRKKLAENEKEPITNYPDSPHLKSFRKLLEKVEHSNRDWFASFSTLVRVCDKDFLYVSKDSKQQKDSYDYRKMQLAMERLNIMAPYGDYKCLIDKALDNLLRVLIEIIP